MSHYDECRESDQCDAPARMKGYKPFERHDARHQTIAPESSLQALRGRLAAITSQVCDSLHGTAALLEEHADRLHGCEPPQNGRASGDAAQPFYGEGQLGDVLRAVDNLELQLQLVSSRLANAAARNANIA